MFQVAIRYNSVGLDGDWGAIIDTLVQFEELVDAYEYCENKLQVFPEPTKDFRIERTATGIVIGKCPLPTNPLYNKLYRGGELLVLDTNATVRSVLQTRLMVMEQGELVNLVIDLVEGKTGGLEIERTETGYVGPDI